MKLLAISLLLCVSDVCIGWSDAGSYSHDHHPLLKPHSHRLLQPHNIIKRQTSDQVRVCNPIIIDVICTIGYYQEYAELLQRCNNFPSAYSVRRICERNSRKDICAAIDTETFETNVRRACNSSSCSSECRSLLTNARNEIGCCMTLYNDSSLAYSYTLWSTCGVETITQNCTDTTFDLEPVLVDITCTEDVLEARTASIVCRREYVEELRKRLSEREECEGFLDDEDDSDFCHANHFGIYCDLLSIRRNLTEAFTSCADTSTCEPHCIETLNNITNTVGCCFNDRYNTSSRSPRDFLSYEYWSRCNLNSPGLCEEFLNNSVTTIRVSVAGAVILVLAALKTVL